jgi:cytoskeletal protein CcmA (bactofilin family)
MLTKNKETTDWDRMNPSTEGSFFNTDVTFKGSLHFKSSLRIDGNFEGEIISKGTLLVGKTGVVKANIKVGNIVVEGKIQGNVQADEKIDLRESARLFGDIKANKLVIAEGVCFVGNCTVNPNNEKIDLEKIDLPKEQAHRDKKIDNKIENQLVLQ